MWNTRAPQGWEQMTPDTKFEDGEWVCFKCLNGDAVAFKYDSEECIFHTDDIRGSQVLHMDTAQKLKFVRLPK